jgi:hypothetical protein
VTSERLSKMGMAEFLSFLFLAIIVFYYAIFIAPYLSIDW